MEKYSLISDPSRRLWVSAGMALMLVLACICFLYKETLFAMIEIWERSETFTHCFLVLPISLWLIWQKRTELSKLTPKPNFLMLIPIACLGAFWLLGSITATNSVAQFAFIGLVISSVVLVLGFSVARVIVFPLGFLFFAVPVGEFLLPTLMEWTANFTIYALRLTGIPVYRDGLQFVIPSGNWSVVEACSGVRYLIASLTVGTLFAYLNYVSTKRRIIFIGISIIVPIFANWLRAYMIVMLGHYSGNTIAVGVDHIIYGWLFFGVVVISMFMIGIRWAEASSSLERKEQNFSEASARQASPSWVWIGCIISILFCAFPIFFAIKINATQNLAAVHLSAPLSLKNWHLLKNSDDGWRPAYKNSASEISEVYENADQRIGLYIGYYRNQFFDKKLISSDNVLVRSEDSHWNIVSRGQNEVKLPETSILVKSSRLSHINGLAGLREQQMDVWYFYWTDGRFTDNDYLVKIYTGLSKLLGRGDDAAVIVLHVLREPSVDSEKTLNIFLRDNYSQINELLHAARTGGGSVITTIEKS